MLTKSPRLASDSDTHLLTVTPSQTTISSRRDKIECKSDLIKTIVGDLYAKQADILRLKQEMDGEYFVHESAGGASYSSSTVDLRSFEKVSFDKNEDIECADGCQFHGRFHISRNRGNHHASI